MSKFIINTDYKRIGIDFNFNADKWDAIYHWCEDKPQYETYSTGIYYQTESDLTAFLLRWS
mgnify:FL=1